MIIEALSFKLALDFFTYLKKYRITIDSTKLGYYDRSKTEYTNFNSVEEMQKFFDEEFRFIDNCILGDLVSIQTFRALSNTYDFETNFNAIDVVGDVKITSGSGFDIQRNSQRDPLKQRQLDFLNKSVKEYVRFYNEIRHIYVTGIYSPCYAEPGWSQNTWYLSSLRKGLLGVRNTSQFPYKGIRIQKDPPV